MPTVKKTTIGDEAHASAKKTTLNDGAEKGSEKASGEQEQSGIERIHRSAFSESDLRGRLVNGEDGDTASHYATLTRSESNLVKPNVRLQLPRQESRNSGGSGLQIVPAYRDLLSESSFSSLTQNRAIASAEDLKERDHHVDHEKRDIVPELFEGWPSFKNRPWRCRSCELVKSSSSCVRKAVSHIHLLQDVLDALYKSTICETADSIHSKPRLSLASDSDSLKQVDDGERAIDGQAMAETALRSSASSHGRRIRWLLSSASLGNIDEESELTEMRLESSASGATLEIRGTSAGTVRSKALTTSRVSESMLESRDEEEAAGYEIIEEVVTLLGRMESDRETTSQALTKERDRVQFLEDEIDRHAYKRMHELPLAVQKEHEACAIDINELRWHCAYRGRIESRTKERVRQAESKNGKLKQDLNNIQKHCPLVEEKLDLEGDAMSSIQTKQDETDDELTQTLRRLAATDQKTAEAQGKATQERALIKQDVDVVRNELNAVSDELAQLKMYFTSNTHTMNDIRNTLRENSEQLVILEKREQRISALEAAQQEKVQRLREKIVEQEAEHVKLTEENNKLKNDKEIMKLSIEGEIAKLSFQIKSATAEYQELTQKKKETNKDIAKIKKQLADCAKRKIVNEKSVKRACQEMEKVAEQITVSKEETKKVEVLNCNLGESLVIQREEVMTVEESLKTTADSLKKQLKDEAHARTVLQARITSDSQDLVKTEVDSKVKRQKATVRADEIEKLVKHVKGQVTKLEKIHKERQETISELDKILERVAQQHADMESKYTGEISQLRPNEEQLKKENLDLTKKIDHMTWKSEMMEKKMQDMASSTIMMNKVTATTQEIINDLNEEITELKIQLETGFETEEDLKSSLNQTEDRVRRGEVDHTQHMASREHVLRTNEKGVKTALEVNKKLAIDYQRFQNTYLNEKASLLRTVERRVHNEGSLKDHRELFVLQGRMRQALEYYYKLRGLQSRAELAHFEVKCAENGDKLVRLQAEMMQVIEHINRFLEANNAAHQVISMEAAQVAQTPPSGPRPMVA